MPTGGSSPTWKKVGKSTGSKRPHIRMRLLSISVVVIGAAVAGIASALTDAPDWASRSDWSKTEMYFGLAIPGGTSNVSDSQFTSFVDEVVTPKFRDGLTLVRASGQWLSPKTGLITREQSRVLIVYHPTDELKSASIREIASEYMKRFSQEGVLYTTAQNIDVCMDPSTCASTRRWATGNQLALAAITLTFVNIIGLVAIVVFLVKFGRLKQPQQPLQEPLTR